MYDITGTYKAQTAEEALELLREHPGAVLVSGGTDVFVKLKNRKLKNAELIYIREITDLSGIQILSNGTIRIGAATPFDEICCSSELRERIPALCEACNQVGSPQIRNIATIGGNLCNGAVSDDSIPILLVYDAELEILSECGTHILPVTKFHTGPGRTVLDSHREIVTAVVIHPEHYRNVSAAYTKFGQRNAMEIATIGCAASVRLDKDKKYIEQLHLAFGVAAPTPVRTVKLENAVKGMEAGAQLYQYVEKHVLEELHPRDSWRASLELREQLIRTLSVRTIKTAIARQGKSDREA